MRTDTTCELRFKQRLDNKLGGKSFKTGLGDNIRYQEIQLAESLCVVYHLIVGDKQDRTDIISSFQIDATRSSCNPSVTRESHVSTQRPHHEEYELPYEAPFIAKLVNVAYNTTEAGIKRTLASLPVKEVRSSGNIPGQYYVEFLDAEGLKQCLDEYWMFKIHGRPIRTYVASAPQSSVKPLNSLTCASNPNAEPKSLDFLTLTSSFQSSSRYIRFQQSLMILVNAHLLRLLCKSSLQLSRCNAYYLLQDLQSELISFFKNVGYVSHHFFESAFLAINVFFQTSTFHVPLEDLPKLCSIACFLKADVQSVFLYVYGIFNVDEILSFFSCNFRFAAEIGDSQ
ncbi:hypothetical protein GEMRC1_000098 [Eukaryota sp. GEM-RC1]